MSTITVSNIKATGETASRAVSGVAAAWANIDGTLSTPAARDSLNQSSITDVTTGIYDMNFTSAMANGNYALSGYSNNNADTNNFSSGEHILGVNWTGAAGRTTSATSIISRVGSTLTDAALNDLKVHGDLA